MPLHTPRLARHDPCAPRPLRTKTLARHDPCVPRSLQCSGLHPLALRVSRQAMEVDRTAGDAGDAAGGAQDGDAQGSALQSVPVNVPMETENGDALVESVSQMQLESPQVCCSVKHTHHLQMTFAPKLAELTRPS